MPLALLYRRCPVRMAINLNQRVYVERLQYELVRQPTGSGSIAGRVDKSAIHLVYRRRPHLNPFRASFHGRVQNAGGQPEITGYFTVAPLGKLVALLFVVSLLAGGAYIGTLIAAGGASPTYIFSAVASWLITAAIGCFLIFVAAAPASQGVNQILLFLQGARS